MFNHDHINGSAEGGRVDGIPRLGDGATQAPNVLHADVPLHNEAQAVVYVLFLTVVCDSNSNSGGKGANRSRASRVKSGEK